MSDQNTSKSDNSIANKSVAHHDVLISGGGLSGLLTAIGLLNETPELSIAIIEPVDKSDQLTNADVKSTSNFDDRCLALSYGSLQLLNHWQVWPVLKPKSWPIKTIITSDRGHAGKTIMRAREYGLNAMGHVSAMKNMGAAFNETLLQLQTGQAKVLQPLTWYCPDSVDSIEQTPDLIYVGLKSGQQVTGKLLVVAEGGNSPTREQLQITTNTEMYEQSAIITNVEVKRKTHNTGEHAANTAFERFTTSGPIAFLPISNDQFSVVWSVKPEQVAGILSLSESKFIEQLQQAFGYGAGKITHVSKPTAYPLTLTKAEQLVHDRVALIGNSAHTIHPIAGQGFNLGLRDVAVLVQQIKEVTSQGVDIGSYSMLDAYQTLRKEDIQRIAGFTDLLVRVFAIEGRPAAAVRTLGLMTLQKFTSLQQWLAIHFMSSKL